MIFNLIYVCYLIEVTYVNEMVDHLIHIQHRIYTTIIGVPTTYQVGCSPDLF